MLLKQMTDLFGVTGHEDAVRAFVREAAAPLCDKVTCDTMGSVYAFRKGSNPNLPHVMLDAHMDEVGFIVTGATDKGLLRIDCAGGIDPRVIVSKRVLVGDDRVPGVIGAKAIHLQSAADMQKVLGYDKLYIDVGAKKKDEALKLCPVGTYAMFDSEYVEFGDALVKAKALDDRVGCVAMLRALKESDYQGDLTCAFTVQEEVGLRGAKVAAYRVKRDLAIALEGTAGKELLSFFRLLCARERLALLPAIQGRYHQLKLEREGGAQAVYCCARQPAPADLARIEEVLKRRHGLSKVEFQVKLEPELLGGFVIHLQGTTYDKSVRGMLRGLRRSLKERE